MITDRQRAMRTLYPIFRTVDIAYEELIPEAQRTVDKVTALIGEVRHETEAPIRELHKPFGIYDECEHEHTEEQVAAGECLEIMEVGLTCEDGLMYWICVSCCTDGDYQTEGCVGEHDHSKTGPICPTIAALDAAQ